MRVAVLYFDGCPTYLEADNALREVLAQEGIETRVEQVAVNTDEEARGFGSPAAPR